MILQADRMDLLMSLVLVMRPLARSSGMTFRERVNDVDSCKRLSACLDNHYFRRNRCFEEELSISVPSCLPIQRKIRRLMSRGSSD